MHRHDSTYHSLCYTSRGALAGMRNSSGVNDVQEPLEGCGPEVECSSTSIYVVFIYFCLFLFKV